MASTETESRGPLPAIVDPMTLAAQGARLVGVLSRSSMPRLMHVCLDDHGEVTVDLQFGRDEGGGMPTLRGTIRAAVRVACQRCLEPMTLELRADPRLLLRRPSDVGDVSASDVETLTVDRPVSLSELVEEELLLAMPMAPMHPFDACPASAWMPVPGSPPRK